MSERDERDDKAVIGTGAAGGAGAQLIVPATAAREDRNGPVPDNEETHDAAEEDNVLMDSGESPEFDHSLHRYKKP